MMLHHLLAVFMTFLSYLAMLFPFGITVFLTSDITDAFLNLTKVSRDLKFYKSFSDYAFATVILSWGFFRGVVMCTCIISSCIIRLLEIAGLRSHEEWTVGHKISLELLPYYMIVIVLLLALAVLNLYWIYIIVTIAYNRVVKKDTNLTNVQHGEKSKKLSNETSEKVNGKHKER